MSQVLLLSLNILGSIFWTLYTYYSYLKKRQFIFYNTNGH